MIFVSLLKVDMNFLSWCHQSALDKLPSEVGKLRQSYYLYKMLYLQPGALSGDLGAEHTH